MATKPLVVIVGQTGSGKSSLAIELAQRFQGEIICADSRTVYRGLDIGTAKPSKEDQRAVRHHLLDVVSPDEPFTVADFKRLADQTIKDVQARGRVPFLVGGSGLYIDAVIYDFPFIKDSSTHNRHNLEKLSITELHEMLLQLHVALPTNSQNPRHLIRAIEMNGYKPPSRVIGSNTIVIGLDLPLEQLQQRLQDRANAMLKEGVIEETILLGDKYGWDSELLKAPIYRAVANQRAHVENVEEIKRGCLIYDLQLAKKQRTWFRRNKSIRWINDPSKVVDIVTTFLNKYT